MQWPAFSHAHQMFAEDIAKRIEVARPRLLRIAQMSGIGLDEAEDVVQETFLEAWRHLEKLREPELFAAWLDGICRNICKRHIHVRATMPGMSELSASLDDIADSFAIDPVAELERQDMQILLARALGHLSESARELVELYYLTGQPQREVARRLNMSLSALEMKLYRARRQLRQVLNGELRADARAFGLLLDEDEAMGWQETRQWCWFCGKHRLRGIFELHPSGMRTLRLRCPLCSTHPAWDVSNTGNWPGMGQVYSFRPAIKRMLQMASDFYDAILQQRRCNICQSLVQFQIIDLHPLKAPSRLYDHLPPLDMYLRVDCPHCGVYLTMLITILLGNPDIRNFFLDRPHVFYQPATLTAYAGQDAFGWQLTDLDTGETLTVRAHPENLQIMATIQE